MKAQFQLGCLKHGEWMRRETKSFDSEDVERRRESYACTPTLIDLPEDATGAEHVYCPFCEQRVQLRLSSPSRLANRLRLALAAGSLLFFAAGFATYFAGPSSPLVANLLMVVAFGGGTSMLVPTVFYTIVHPEFVDRRTVSVIRDYVLDNQLIEVVAERKRHKVYDVFVEHEPYQAPQYLGDPGSVMSGVVMN